MIDKSIHSLASKLDEQLQGKGSRSMDPSDRELLKQLRRDIQSILDGPDSSVTLARLDPGFLDRLREATNRFETSHPALTAIMAQVTSSLSNMGI